MMNKYESLYKKGANQEDVKNIFAFASNMRGATWEDCIWAAKCLFKYDDGDSNPDTLTLLVNAAYRFGLTVRTNPDLYKDGIKILAVMYGMFGKYELVVNQLLAYLEIEPNCPAWVYHDLVEAQIHTDELDRMITAPTFFVSDIKKSDDGKVSVKQVRIFKNFLKEAARYISDHQSITVASSEIEGLAEYFDVKKSFEWKNYVSVIGGGDNEEKTIEIAIAENEEKPVFVSLDDVQDNPVEYKTGEEYDAIRIQLSKAENELKSEKEKYVSISNALENKNSENEELKQKLEQMQNEKEKNKKELEESFASINSVNNLVEELTEKLSKSQKDNEKEKKKAAELIGELKSTQSRMNNLAAEAAEKDNQIQALQAKADGGDSDAKLRITRIEKEKSEIEQKYYDQSKLLKNQQSQIKEYQSQIQLYKGNAERIEFELKQLRDSMNTVPAMVGRMQTLVSYTSLAQLTRWLGKILPKISDNWMEECVMEKLSNNQLDNANEKGCCELADFDLAALIRVADKNWSSICQYEHHGYDDRQYIKAMVDVRNNWSHFSSSSLDMLKSDLSIIKNFFNVIGADVASKSEVRDFLSTMK